MGVQLILRVVSTIQMENFHDVVDPYAQLGKGCCKLDDLRNILLHQQQKLARKSDTPTIRLRDRFNCGQRDRTSDGRHGK